MKVTRQGTGSMGVPRQSQVAGLSALKLGGDYHAGRIEELRMRGDRAAVALRELGFKAPTPEGGCFLWVSTDRLGLAGDHLSASLLEDLRLVAMPGSAFTSAGDTRHLRLSFGVPDDDMEEALRRLATWDATASADGGTGRRPRPFERT